MALRFEVYEPRHIKAALAFNERMLARGVDPGLLLNRQPTPFDPNLPLSTESRVVVDGEYIRGGYLLQWRDFWIGGKLRRVCAYQTPISEGLVDRKYAAVGSLLVRHALSVNPLLYAVGMGGPDRPLPRMLRSMGFHVTTVPFLFRIHRSGRFLREIQHLRSTASRRLALNALRLSGLAWLGTRSWQFLHAVRHAVPSVSFKIVDTLDGIADQTWERSRDQYSMLAVRDAAMLRSLLSGGAKNYRRIQVSQGNDPIGWAVVVEKQMERNKYFGNMKVGVIADCLAAPEHAAAVIQAAARCLSQGGVDITLGNFQHPGWIGACRQAGFLSGPSNHCLALSPQLAEMARLDTPAGGGMHITRSDSDGLVNL